MSVRNGNGINSSGLSNLFNLHVEWHEPTRGSAVLSWRLEQSAFPRDLVKQWVEAHLKLTAFVAEQLLYKAKRSTNKESLSSQSSAGGSKMIIGVIGAGVMGSDIAQKLASLLT